MCDSVLEQRERGVALRDQAVLFRPATTATRSSSSSSAADIPFVKYGGLKFLEAAHVKDLLALLRILENPSDELAWHRVLGLLDGVGPATRAGSSTSSRWPRRTPCAPRSSPTTAPAAGAARDARSVCAPRSATAASGPTVARRCRSSDCARRVRAALRRAGTSTASSTARRPRAAAFAGRRLPSRSRFLAELTLDPPTSTGDLAGPPHLDDDFLILSTIHSAKGGEWQVVHLIHASDGNIPSDMSLGSADEVEEERRLFYVALTRARDTLVVSYPLRYYFRRNPLDDAHSYGQASRFLTPAAATFDTTSVGEAVVDDDPVAGELAALWQ